MYVWDSLLAALYDCAQIFDRAGACVYANRAAATCLGQTQDGIVGKTWRELGFAAESAAEMDAGRDAVFSTGHPRKGEVIMVTEHGDRVFEYTLNPIVNTDNGVESVVYLARDVTERQRSEDAERQAFQEALALNARLRRAVYGASHRIKNHLQLLAATADLQLLEGEETIPAADFRRWIGHVRTVAAVHELLTVETQAEPTADTVSVRSLLEGVLELFEDALGARQIRFAIQEADVPVRTAMALAILAIELIANAAKHGASEMEVLFHIQGARGRFEVSDDGPGLPEGFDPEADDSTGVELVRSLVQWDLGGQIQYDNVPAGGTRVTITMPIDESSQQSGFSSQ